MKNSLSICAPLPMKETALDRFFNEPATVIFNPTHSSSNRLHESHPGVIEIIPKTLPQVIGEQIVGPFIRYTAQFASKAWSTVNVLASAFQFPGAYASEISPGTIMYTNERNCPEGWVERTDLAGRTLLGKGNYIGVSEDGRQEAKIFDFQTVGGEIQHRLTLSEIPSHTHPRNQDNLPENGNVYPHLGKGPIIGVFTSGRVNEITAYSTTGSSGGGQSHNIMQPYYAITICEKVNNPNEKIGIRTTNPQAALDVNGDIRSERLCSSDGSTCKTIAEINSVDNATINKITKIEQYQSNFEDQLNQTITKIISLESIVQDLSNHLQTAQTQLIQIENRLNQGAEKISNLESIVQNLSNGLQTTQTQLIQVENRLNQGAEKVSSLESIAQNLSNMLQAAQTQLTQIENRLNQEATNISDLKSNIQNFSSDLEAVKYGLTQVQAKLNEHLNSQCNNNSAQIILGSMTAVFVATVITAGFWGFRTWYKIKQLEERINNLEKIIGQNNDIPLPNIRPAAFQP